MLRKLLTITSRVGRPSTRLDVGDSGGRILYLGANMHPVGVVVALERDQVRHLIAVCSSWLAELDQQPAAAHHHPLRRVSVQN